MKTKSYLIIFTLLIFANKTILSQEEKHLSHYMPLFVDIPAELNVEKGYKEIDLGFGYADYDKYHGYRGLAEFDFAPIKRLGFEIEVPVNVAKLKQEDPLHVEPEHGGHGESENTLESLAAVRFGVCYSLLVLPKAKTTVAIGYNNELETSPFKHFGDPLFAGNIYKPFVVVAKVWGNRFHSMIYTGPSFQQEFHNNHMSNTWKLNTTLSYRFGKDEKDHFVGVEINQSALLAEEGSIQTIFRPQLQLAFTEQWSLGIVGTIPADNYNNLKGGGFLRLIYLFKN